MFRFPNPVDEYAARTVAFGVAMTASLSVLTGQHWLLVPLTYGFVARLLTGPTLSPLGQIATRLVAPRLPRGPKPVPGPPKRFAQGIGVIFATSALVLYYGFGLTTASTVVLLLLSCAAGLEALFGICLGCLAFGLFMRVGVIPADVCEACADLSLHHPGFSVDLPD